MGRCILRFKPADEFADDAAFKALEEDQKRVFLRNELREHNKLLVEILQNEAPKKLNLTKNKSQKTKS